MRKHSKKIAFIPLGGEDISIGSYRIWVKDYCQYMKNIGINAKIAPMINDQVIQENDIIVLGKGPPALSARVVEYVSRKYPSKIVGAITPPGDLTTVPYDFVMVGSMEEADSLSFHKNVIVNAHIESLYYDSEPKIHEHKDILKICVHGWTAHLASFAPNLKWALEEYEKEQDFELVVISEKTDLSSWSKGRPNIKNIVSKKWDLNTIKSNIQECDIGIVPGVHDLTDKLEIVDPANGKFETDYIFRFKNKCNNGRALVYFQLGIPTVLDFSPSHLHILGDGDCGYLAHSKHGWLRALRLLKDFNNRNTVSRNALNKVNQEYNPSIWADRYYQALHKIHDDKQQEVNNER